MTEQVIESFLLDVIVDGSHGTVISIDSTSDFKYLVKGTRNYLGISQTEFAKLLGTNQATISQWEQGVVTPTLSTILRMSNFIETPILIGRPRI